ncbi:MAG: MFS transporter [Ktedonobacteraceae bacterium]|nr:MFS transporter [Ktedonobacteraceae bacterium]MBO0792946.1 MFS transporter [Ktedonobacteraceae bacterium]
MWNIRKRLLALLPVTDARLIIWARALRTFGYGFTSVLLGVALTDAGLSALNVGILLTVASLGSITFSFIMGLYADRLGRKRLLMVSACLMMGTGLTFACTGFYPLLLVAAFCGTISPSTNDNTAFSGVEQAILAQSSSRQGATSLYALYNLSAQLAGAVGGLLVGLTGVLAHMGVSERLYVHVLFALYGLVAGCTALLFMRLSRQAELPVVLQKRDESKELVRRRSGLRVRGVVLVLLSLFAFDSFAGGLAVQTILSMWFRQRFGVTLGSLGMLFFGVNLLAALSLVLAPRLTRRFGLLSTMLAPHFISNIFLVLVACMPTFPLAALCLLLRQSLSKMDVPARQAFTAALVSPQERTATASFATIARSTAVSISPLASSVLLIGPLLALGLPILLAGVLEIGYDVTMWRTFKHVSLLDERAPNSLTETTMIHATMPQPSQLPYSKTAP